jgi:hypothetical protein
VGIYGHLLFGLVNLNWRGFFKTIDGFLFGWIRCMEWKKIRIRDKQLGIRNTARNPSINSC